MKQSISIQRLLVVTLLLGACAPARPVATGPAPAPEAPAPAPQPPQPPAATPNEAPDDWWLLDRTANGVFGTSAERAYRELIGNRQPGRQVVVAIIDSGIDIEHVDLDGNIWTNAREVAGNNRDDDGNGYVDDVHGWSFIGGPNGDVNQDTYEVTRLLADCRRRNDTSATCRGIQEDYDEKRNETEDLLEQYQNIGAAFANFSNVLKTYLNTQTLTRAQVSAIRETRPDVRQAQQVWLQLDEAGVTQEALDEGLEALNTELQFGLNLTFDPRPIVGDNYADGTERIYGNNHVEGPSAEHGTHVAGIVGAERNNGVGMNGIAPSVRLMPIRAVPDGDERDKDVANAIRYAVDNGAQIINMSFGKGYSPGKNLVDDAVKYAESRGVLLVHAAGNDGENLDQEGNFPNKYYESGGEASLWIEVGASNWGDAGELAAEFSNYSARKVDVFAPGVEIYSTVPDNEYERNQGTSMAAPVVSGLAAMIMAYYPQLTAAQVRQIILETATRYPSQLVDVPGESTARRPFSELSVTGGIVNAYEALRRAAQMAGGR